MGFKFRLPELGRVGLFTIELQNVGKTPAQIDAMSVTGRVVESSSYQGEVGENISPKQEYHGRLLVSDKPLQKGVVVDYNPAWGDVLPEELVDGNAFILIQAHVEYRDIYEKHHETKIAMILAWTGKESVDDIEPRVSQAGGSEWNVVI